MQSLIFSRAPRRRRNRSLSKPHRARQKMQIEKNHTAVEHAMNNQAKKTKSTPLCRHSTVFSLINSIAAQQQQKIQKKNELGTFSRYSIKQNDQSNVRYITSAIFTATDKFMAIVHQGKTT